MNLPGFYNVIVAVLFCPLLLSIINRTKAFFAGRAGQPWLQPYRDIIKLLRKGAVYSRTTSWVFRAGPMVGLAAALTALALVPLGGNGAPLSFAGDLILFAYMLGLMRFFTVIAALDTGSAFEGMGASREVFFSALAEPAFLLGLTVLARHAGTASLSEITGAGSQVWAQPESILVMVALLTTFLCENARIPFDDPNTHLELTMIHEVMVLDHGGPDFAYVLYGAALKLWVLGAVVVSVVLPIQSEIPWVNIGIGLLGMIALAIFVGIVESVMARLRLLRVPYLLMGASVVSVLAVILSSR
jgi:formate hydrogenlyase subunit 4